MQRFLCVEKVILSKQNLSIRQCLVYSTTINFPCISTLHITIIEEKGNFVTRDAACCRQLAITPFQKHCGTALRRSIVDNNENNNDDNNDDNNNDINDDNNYDNNDNNNDDNNNDNKEDNNNNDNIGETQGAAQSASKAHIAETQ